MNKWWVCCLLAIGIGGCISFSIENEFIKQPKEKRFYPSCQQYIELEAEVVGVINSLLSISSSLFKSMVDVQGLAISDINEYLEGDKSCFLQSATKDQRADSYAKKLKIKNKIIQIAHQLQRLSKELDDVLADSPKTP